MPNVIEDMLQLVNTAAGVAVNVPTAAGVKVASGVTLADKLAELDAALVGLTNRTALATQTRPGLVKGSATVKIGADGSVNVVGGTGESGGGATVVSPPLVHVPPQVGIGFPFDITLHAGPVLLPGASVTDFVLTISVGNATGEPVCVPASNGAGMYTATVQTAENALLTIAAAAMDSLENISDKTIISVQLVISPIAPAVILSPAENEQNVALQPTIILAPMQVHGEEDSAQYVQVQIAADEAFTQLIFDTGETFAATTTIVPTARLHRASLHFSRARWTTARNGTGPWSAVRTFHTESTILIRCCQVADGITGQTWQRIDVSGKALAVSPNVSAHPTYAGMVERVIDGQYMIGIPKCFVSRETLTTGAFTGKDARGLSDMALPGYEIHPAFLAHSDDTVDDMIWIGKYQACDTGSSMAGSLPGVMPLRNLSFDDARRRCTNRNVGGVAGFHMWNIHEISLIQLMMLLEYGGTDMQSLIGRGNVDSNTSQSVDSATVSTASWRGLTGLWGNLLQMCDGIRSIGGGKTVKLDMGKGFVNTTIQAKNADAGYNRMYNGRGDGWNADHLFVGDMNHTAEITAAAYPDMQSIFCNSNQDHCCGVGGSKHTGSNGGLFLINMAFPSGWADDQLGSRIAKR